MRKKMIAGNWKMYKTPSQAGIFVHQLTKEVSGAGLLSEDGPEVVLCPPYLGIAAISEAVEVHKITFKVGAQNLFWEDEGAFTGEISAPMLKDLGVDYVIVGHSERRQYFGETDQDISKKARAAWAHGLKVILCVGESLEKREAGEENAWVGAQLRNSISGLSPDQWSDLVIAYEPIWAIGTGKNATPEDAASMAATIRKTVGSLGGPEQGIRVLYGGSVNPSNAASLLTQEGVDGALVGGACLKTETFLPIIKAAL